MEIMLEKQAPPTKTRGGSQWDDVIAALSSEENRGEWFKVGTEVTRAQQAHLQRTAAGLGWHLRTQTESTEDGYDADKCYAALYACIDMTWAEHEAIVAERDAKKAAKAAKASESNGGAAKATTSAAAAKAKAAAKKAATA